MISNLDDAPQPTGELMLQTSPMPKDTNASGDIFGGWLVSQMDIAGGIAAAQVAQGRVATVAIDSMSFMIPVKVGSIVSCYTEVLNIGRSSIQIQVEVWMRQMTQALPVKVTEGVFVFVALDDKGRTRAIQ
ncbi:MAG TPA: acyl-CoA thioesterase [Pseudomonadales bacterium]